MIEDNIGHNGDTRTKSGHCEVGTKRNEIFNHFHLNIILLSAILLQTVLSFKVLNSAIFFVNY